MGTPQDFTEDTAREICLRTMKGESMRAICRDDFMPPRWQIYEWLAENKTFSDQYARACEIRADAVFDDIFEIADDNQSDVITNPDGTERLNSDVVQRAKLRIDTRKWALARMQPKKYGDKIDLNHGVGLTISIAGDDAAL